MYVARVSKRMAGRGCIPCLRNSCVLRKKCFQKWKQGEDGNGNRTRTKEIMWHIVRMICEHRKVENSQCSVCERLVRDCTESWQHTRSDEYMVSSLMLA